MPKDGADPLRPLGQAAHVADRGSLQLLLAARRRLARDRLLEVGMDALVRVQLRTVRGQVEHLDLRAALGQPVLNQAGPVHLQAVQDQEDLATRLPDLKFIGDISAPWPRNTRDRKSTRLNSSHANISYAVFCLKK